MKWSGVADAAPGQLMKVGTMTKTVKAAGETRELFVSPDVIDIRDRYYRPKLMALPQQIIPEADSLKVRDQGQSSACTGFALASVIDRQCKPLFGNGGSGPVSTRMLFQMARLHDDLPDAEFAGSTLRGALKGFFHNGACPEVDAPFVPLPGKPDFTLTLDLAEKARNVSLGAYYRLNHEINDYHTAINEADAIIVSARIHSGWITPKEGVIQNSTREKGRHAFAIVGYNSEGFLVQNSWGKRWSTWVPNKHKHLPDDDPDKIMLEGVALWPYDDWYETVEDAWVLRLAISSPSAFQVKFARNHKAFREAKASSSAFVPRRQDVIGHFLHFDDGELVPRGRYAQDEDDIAAMLKQLTEEVSARKRKYDHLLFIAHGALQSAEDVAARARAWRKVFVANRIYPVHLMWETAFNNEVVDVIKDLLLKTSQRMNKDSLHTDARLEEIARPLGRKLWRDLKITSQLSTEPSLPAGNAILQIIQAAGPLKLHFLSQSAGVLLFSEFLDLLGDAERELETATMMAPACDLQHFAKKIKPHIGKQIKSLTQYGLIEKREREDSVEIYSKSLLYLVSNAIEERPKTKLLGLAEHFDKNDCGTGHKLFLAGKDRSVTEATSHRGFDADRKTMNHLLEVITGFEPAAKLAFREADLTGY